MEIAVLIPAYQPDSVLISLVQALHRENFRLIVTDDGSGPAYADIFSALLPYAEVLTCPENRGKGHALKCALRHLAADPQGCRAFITADADGQHTVADILRVREALLSGSRFVLTTRTLHGKSVPLRSRVGNDLSRFFFSLAAGCFLEDNQSGLRGFSTDCLPWLTEIGGEKYDYEMNVLLYAARQELPITQLPIETVYLDGNQSSHFDPLRDTLRIYRRMLDTARGSVLAWLLHVADARVAFLPVFHPAVWCGQRGAELLLQPLSGLPPRALCLWAAHAVRRSRAHIAAAAVLLHPAPARPAAVCRMAHRLCTHRSAGICLRPPDGPVVVKLCAAPFLTSGPSPLRSLPGGRPRQSRSAAPAGSSSADPMTAPAASAPTIWRARCSARQVRRRL